VNPMTEPFRTTLYARWGDIDLNGHMRNIAYLDSCVDVRMMFFAAQGFSPREFERRRIGPVVLRDEIDYFREVRLHESIDVTLAIAALSGDGSHFRLRNEFWRADGQRAATVTSRGSWLDLERRRLTVPPDELRAILEDMPRTVDFEEIDSLIRS
jgi:acyl-CoA thioester hydrolase